MARLLAQDRVATRGLHVATALGFVAAMALVAFVVLLARVVAEVAVDGGDLRVVTPELATMAGLVVLRAAALWIAAVVAAGAAIGLRVRLRHRIADRLATMGPLEVGAERSGELAGVAGDAVDAVGPHLTAYRPARALAGAVPVAVFVVIAVLDPWTTLVLLFAGPMLVLLLALIGGRTRALTDRRFAELRWLDAFFLDVVQGLTTLKVFGRSREEADTIEEVSTRFGHSTLQVLATAFQTSLVMEWAAVAATALVAVEVGFRLVADHLTLAPGLAVLVLTPEFFAPLRRMALEYHAGTTGDAAATRLLALLDDGPEPAGPMQTAPAPASPTAGSTPPPGRVTTAGAPASATSPTPTGGGRVTTADDTRTSGTTTDGDPRPAPVRLELRGVSASYPGSASPAVRDLSLVVAPGERVALVGASGAGKTTVANLVLGFLSPDHGTVLVDGTPLPVRGGSTPDTDPLPTGPVPTGNALGAGGSHHAGDVAGDVGPTAALTAWRHRIGWVPQRPHLFAGTVADNLRLGAPDADHAALVVAAVAADADTFIRALPLGYDTPLGERGLRLSGGQRQRLAIARAFLRDPALLVLDEFTANLDPVSETAVLAAMDRLATGRTTLLIAHRPSTAETADRVVTLRNGRIVDIRPGRGGADREPSPIAAAP